MKILYCKNLWWPFGAHLIHCLYRKIFCDIKGYKLLYTKNDHPGYSFYNGEMQKYFPNLSHDVDSDLAKLVESQFSNSNHNDHYLVTVSETNEIISSEIINLSKHIHESNWDTFYSAEYSSPEKYKSSVMKKMAEPSSDIKIFLDDLSFIKKTSALNGNYIAVHIRWTDKVRGRFAESFFYDVGVYFEHAIKTRKENGINNIVLNCDNRDALEGFLSYNLNNQLNFNIIYDEEESLPPNNWLLSICQRLNTGAGIEKKEIVRDMFNGFKIYKTLLESKVIIGDFTSNMCLAPVVARNCKEDINIRGSIPYSLLRPKQWTKDQFGPEIEAERERGLQIYNQEIKNNLNLK